MYVSDYVAYFIENKTHVGKASANMTHHIAFICLGFVALAAITVKFRLRCILTKLLCWAQMVLKVKNSIISTLCNRKYTQYSGIN